MTIGPIVVFFLCNKLGHNGLKPHTHTSRKYVDTLPAKEKAPLLLTDAKLRECVGSLLTRLDVYYTRLCVMARLVHSLTSRLPNAPLGRQVSTMATLGHSHNVFINILLSMKISNGKLLIWVRKLLTNKDNENNIVYHKI